ncbi:MAG: hypothetical protein IJU76_03990, partial [Desulfovibrionaceae bacterium]|nr:hypothetical protein [Desulfovibrionaceae bacterium]
QDKECLPDIFRLCIANIDAELLGEQSFVKARNTAIAFNSRQDEVDNAPAILQKRLSRPSRRCTGFQTEVLGLSPLAEMVCRYTVV